MSEYSNAWIDMCHDNTLNSACAVASGVAVEFIACQAGPICTW